MRARRIVLAGVVLVPLVGVGVALVAARLSHRPVEVGLVDGRLRPCATPSNCVCSETGNSEATIAPLELVGEPAQAFGALIDLVESFSDAEIVTAEDNYLHAVFYTPLLRFADDVEFRLDPDARVIHVRSASRVGRSDLGANRARVEELRRRWSGP